MCVVRWDCLCPVSCLLKPSANLVDSRVLPSILHCYVQLLLLKSVKCRGPVASSSSALRANFLAARPPDRIRFLLPDKAWANCAMLSHADRTYCFCIFKMGVYVVSVSVTYLLRRCLVLEPVNTWYTCTVVLCASKSVSYIVSWVVWFAVIFDALSWWLDERCSQECGLSWWSTKNVATY